MLAKVCPLQAIFLQRRMAYHVFASFKILTRLFVQHTNNKDSVQSQRLCDRILELAGLYIRNFPQKTVQVRKKCTPAYF